MNKELIISMKTTFDNLVHYDEEIGIEYWYAREIQTALGYVRWENFDTAIKRSQTACKTAKIHVSDHFRDVTKMVTLGSVSTRIIQAHKNKAFACRRKKSHSTAKAFLLC